MKIAILLNWSINTDSRAQRTAYSLAKRFSVDIYCIGDESEVRPSLLEDKIGIFRIKSILPTLIDRILLPFYSNTNSIFKSVLNSSNHYDAIYCHDLDTLQVGVKLSKVYHSKLVYDIHDLSILTLNQGFDFKVNFIKRLYYSLRKSILSLSFYLVERMHIGECDLIFTVNDSIASYVQRSYTIKCNVIYNFPLLVNKPIGAKLNNLKKEKNKRKILLYHGNFGRGRFLSEIVKAAYHFNSDLLLILIGNGELKEDLVKISNNENTIFINQIEYSELLDFVSSADIGIVLLEHINYSKKHASANKLYEYMAAGLAVLSSNSPELNKVTVKSDIGIVLSSVTEYTIAETLNNMTLDETCLKNWKENSRRLFETDYVWSTQEEKILELFQEIGLK
jgi:starch synthase